MTATVGDTYTGLVLACRAADPDDSLPWLVLADYLDETGDARAERVRWWRHHRESLIRPVDWTDGRQTDWQSDLEPRIDAVSGRCRWLGRLYGIEVLRACLEECPLENFNGRADCLRTIRATLAVAECHALGLASDSELSAAESAAESAAWSAVESAAWYAARSSARSAARSAAWSAAWYAAWSAARYAAESAARYAACPAAEQILSRFERVEIPDGLE